MKFVLFYNILAIKSNEIRIEQVILMVIAKKMYKNMCKALIFILFINKKSYKGV